MGIVGLMLFRRSGALPRWFTAGLWSLSIVVGSWTVWTANVGGRIRHAEIRPEFSPSVAAEGETTVNRGEGGKTDDEQ